MELLTNALEHGNCNISFTEKTAWFFSGKEMIDLIMEKNKDPEIAAKRIHISYLITNEKSYFKIKDEGKGFDWHYQMSGEEDEPQLHSNSFPGIMETFEMVHFTDKQVVCRQNEPSTACTLLCLVVMRYMQKKNWCQCLPQTICSLEKWHSC